MVFATGFGGADDGNFVFGADTGAEEVVAGFEPGVVVALGPAPGTLAKGFAIAGTAGVEGFVWVPACEAPFSAATG